MYFSSTKYYQHTPASRNGMITSLKVGYKTKMLGELLAIFDTEGGYEQAAVERERQYVGVGVCYTAEKQLC